MLASKCIYKCIRKYMQIELFIVTNRKKKEKNLFCKDILFLTTQQDNKIGFK